VANPRDNLVETNPQGSHVPSNPTREAFAAFANAPFGFAACDADGTFRHANAMLEELVGPISLGTTNYFDQIPADDLARERGWFAGLQHAGSSRRETTWRSRAGEPVSIHVTGWVCEVAGEVLVCLTAERNGHTLAEIDRLAHMRFLAAMQRVNEVIRRASNVKDMLAAVLDEMLSIFDCDRAWLLFPCEPTSPTWFVPMERTKPGWPGVLAIGVEVPMAEGGRRVFEIALEHDDPTAYGPAAAGVRARPLPAEAVAFSVKSQFCVAVHPKVGMPWLLGLHHCVKDHAWTIEEQRIFQEIGFRIGDALSSLLVLRDLRSSEERYRTLLEHAPEAVVVIDVESERFSYVNPNAEVLFGMSEPQLLGLGLCNVSPVAQPDGRASATLVTEAIREAAAGAVAAFQWHVRTAEGRAVPCEVRLVRLAADGSQVRGSIIDISERVRLEEHLRQAQKMEAVGLLAGGVAHDFNNLLTVIHGYTEILRSGEDCDELATIAEAADQAAYLTRQLLLFSRSAVIQPRVLDPFEVVTNTYKLLTRVIGEDIELEIAGESEDPWSVLADPGQLQQILMNLAVNARDAMPRGGKLTVETRNVSLGADYVGRAAKTRPGRYVMIAVADNGVGIDAATQKRIFEPFFTTKPEGHGTGLGLATVKDIVQQLDGTIRVYSELGQGTCFKVYLPITEVEPRARAARPPSLPESRGTETILLVEDADDVRQLMNRLLEEAGYQVLAATSPAEALRIWAKQERDVALLVSDVVMPGMNGRELSERLSADKPDLKTLYVSGYTPRAILRHGILTDQFSFLSKPFAPNMLLRTVRFVLDRTEHVEH
jgi:PAS domain S-box-containing protein